MVGFWENRIIAENLRIIWQGLVMIHSWIVRTAWSSQACQLWIRLYYSYVATYVHAYACPHEVGERENILPTLNPLFSINK